MLAIQQRACVNSNQGKSWRRKFKFRGFSFVAGANPAPNAMSTINVLPFSFERHNVIPNINLNSKRPTPCLRFVHVSFVIFLLTHRNTQYLNEANYPA